jgi:hypothetical protein
MQSTVKTLIAVCAFSMVAGIASGNLITNPSFETPVVTAGSFENFSTGSTGITGWAVTGPADTGVSIVSTTFVQDGVTFGAESGNQWVDLTGDGSNSTEGIMQSVATTPGTNYALTFYIGNTTGGGIFGTTSTGALYINGTEVNTYENSNADSTGLNWEQFTYGFTASGASTTIGFVNLDPSTDNSNGLDMVDLEVGAPATVPEPASIWLVGAALVVMAFLIGRKRLAT